MFRCQGVDFEGETFAEFEVDLLAEVVGFVGEPDFEGFEFADLDSGVLAGEAADDFAAEAGIKVELDAFYLVVEILAAVPEFDEEVLDGVFGDGGVVGDFAAVVVELVEIAGVDFAERAAVAIEEAFPDRRFFGDGWGWIPFFLNQL